VILTAYFSIIFGPPGCSDALVNSFELTREGGTWCWHTRKEFRNIICFALDSRQPCWTFATESTYMYNHPAALSRVVLRNFFSGQRHLAGVK
jgi:hypothetical protein